MSLLDQWVMFFFSCSVICSDIFWAFSWNECIFYWNFLLGYVWFDKLLRERKRKYFKKEKRKEKQRKYHFSCVRIEQKKRKMRVIFLFLYFLASFVGKLLMKGFSSVAFHGKLFSILTHFLSIQTLPTFNILFTQNPLIH